MIQVKAALESLSSVVEVTAWYENTPHSKDMLGEYCPWRKMYVRLERTPGDLPLLEVITTNLTGDGLSVMVEEVSNNCDVLYATYVTTANSDGARRTEAVAHSWTHAANCREDSPSEWTPPEHLVATAPL